MSARVSSTPDLLFDENLSWRVARGLRAQGFSIQTVAEAGLAGKQDKDVFLYARIHHKIIVSRDSDFLTRFKPPHAGVIHVTAPGSVRTAELLNCLASQLPALLTQSLTDLTHIVVC